MSVRITLEKPEQLYTNLDFIRGTVILSLRSHEEISAITVKLEGESISRLVGELPLPHGYGAGFGRRRDETTVETEVHKEREFKFFPIEPPRPAPTANEFFARLDHHFAPVTEVPPTVKSVLFARKPTISSKDGPIITPPVVRLDARLPHPAIITCNQTIPLRIIVTKLNASPANIYLQLLQIELVAYTRVRAHHLTRDNATSTVIISKSNMHKRLSMNDEKSSEIDQSLWKDLELPPMIAPTFDTCNITRTYQLQVKIGLLHGHGGHVFVSAFAAAGVSNIASLTLHFQPELNVQTLKLAVDVYSGIAPPPALLRAMSAPSNAPHTSNAAPNPSNPPPKPPRPASSSLHHQDENPQIIHTEIPIGSGQTHPVDPFSPRPNAPVPQEAETGPEGPFPDVAPPTYQEAVADGIGPVGGPRGVYDGTEAGSGAEGSSGTGAGASRLGEERSSR
ncbi:MAG: hypothetical protein Q9183_001407 [Haloplaca sp. 2 TL-2023]